uniref:Uncharacterized protein n=1 Tax=Ceratitis capitata TaxID=7213 RepID=W8C4V5_CERCA
MSLQFSSSSSEGAVWIKRYTLFVVFILNNFSKKLQNVSTLRAVERNFRQPSSGCPTALSDNGHAAIVFVIAIVSSESNASDLFVEKIANIEITCAAPSAAITPTASLSAPRGAASWTPKSAICKLVAVQNQKLEMDQRRFSFEERKF